MASNSRPPPSRNPARSPESFEALRQRLLAAEILSSYERLSWVAFERCETIAQTRLHCKRLVAGFSPDDEDELIKWEEDFTPHPRKEDESSRSKSGKKGKERASLGGERDSGQSGSKGKDRKSPGGEGEVTTK